MKTNEDVKRQALLLIEEKLKEAYKVLEECQALAVEADVGFSFEPAYGMGGWFDPEEGAWVSSSQNC